MKVDMHTHTRRSFDSLNDPEALMACLSARNIDRVCITDHNEIEGALELARAYPHRVVVGEEVKTAERVDVIGLYISTRIPKGTPARRTCELIHAQGGIVYMPHPYAGGKGGDGRLLDELADLIDVVEGFNARLHDQALNDRAVAWARQHGKPVGAGSDAHTLGELGRAWVEVPQCANEPQAFLAALREGTINGTLSSRAVHVASAWAKARHWMERS
jgi:predicted metal-dependent phosphoesterase TrpH